MSLTIIDVKRESEVPGLHHTYVACINAEEAVKMYADRYGVMVSTVYRNLRPNGRCSLYILKPIGGEK